MSTNTHKEDEDPIMGDRHHHHHKAPKRDPIVIGIAAVAAIAGVVTFIMVAATIPLVKDVKSKQNTLDDQMQTVTNVKWACDYETPRYYQVDRGTCWDFATIGLLEQSYRQNGVKKGFLQRDEYVKFSEQAYGISMMRACAKHPEVCDVPGDYVIQNSTEGGEIGWIYSLSELYNKVLPVAVCPYTDIDGETQCPGIDKALDQNPIRFDIKSMEVAYNAKDTRALLLKYKMPLGWSSLMHVVSYYFPCSDSYWGAQDICNETNKVTCPTDRFYYSQFCGEVQGAMYNMDGEFFMHGVMEIEGGHAMNVVGFNDGFVTREGFKGGFIIRNSWYDLVYGDNPYGRGARGSHSIAYWMQEISAWDEFALCPNPLNPANWLSCVQQSPGPTGRRSEKTGVTKNKHYRTGPLAADDYFDISETCLDASFMEHLVNVSLQPTEFQCKNTLACDDSYRYFVVSTQTSVQGDLLGMTMLGVNKVDQSQIIVATPLNNPSALAYIWEPLQIYQDMLVDSEDWCGYYFWPYDVLDKQVGGFRNYYAHYFDIEWQAQSYLLNKEQYGSYNYTLMELSSGKQPAYNLPTTNPHDTVRY
ncbi:hect e3 ubiquitin [Pelomyxa schiedti]|nr:hect e3 ubiquitin [Pelomyxa schiedti]